VPSNCPTQPDPSLSSGPWSEYLADPAIGESDLHDAAVRPDGSHVAGRIEKPEPLPSFRHRAEVIRRVQQLLHPPLRPRRIERDEAADRSRQAGEQGDRQPDVPKHADSLASRIRLIFRGLHRFLHELSRSAPPAGGFNSLSSCSCPVSA